MCMLLVVAILDEILANIICQKLSLVLTVCVVHLADIKFGNSAQ